LKPGISNQLDSKKNHAPCDHHFLEAWNLEPGTLVILTVPFMRHVIITHDIDFKLDLTAKNFSR
jgi:hypothetical protein